MQKKTIKEISIWDECKGEDNFSLIAKIDEDENLILDGFDIGPSVKQWWGDADYEYWYVIKKEWKDSLLLYLLAEKFTLSNTPQGWLESKDIPFEFSSYI